MHIPHNEIVTVLGAALSLVVFMLGYWRGHYRAYAECCDCCTCQTCEPELIKPKIGRGMGHSFTEDGKIIDFWEDEDVTRHEPYPEAVGTAEIYERRHAVVLEPGGTIFPELAKLAGEVMDGPHSDPEPIDSTWLRLLMLDWDRRYPIPQEVR